MSRSKWKLPFIILNEIQKVFEKKTKKIYSRSSTIPLLLLNQKVEVYNGKVFKPLFITRNKIGYKFGEFVTTRTLSKKQKKVKKPTKKSKT